jgi:acetylornithine deacetylase/succinyl-diaminopimelate desuccinylase-like protein
VNQFYAEMKRIIDDPSVEIVPAQANGPLPAPSRLDTEMYRTLDVAAKKTYGDSVVMIPTMLTGGTDMSPLRLRGVQCYGIGPLVAERDMQDLNGIHGDNERLLESELYRFLRFQWEAVRGIAGAPR